jgi:hypothetical protein
MVSHWILVSHMIVLSLTCVRLSASCTVWFTRSPCGYMVGFHWMITICFRFVLRLNSSLKQYIRLTGFISSH